MRNRLLKGILAKVDALPALPGVVHRVMEISSDPEYQVDDLVRALSLDPGITAAVLRRANSSFFGLRHKAQTLAQAVPHLGLDNILEIALSSGVAGQFQGGAEGYEIPAQQLWRHSLATALTASTLCRELRIEEAPLIFTAGLLHDIGKLVLSEVVAEQLMLIKEVVEREGAPLTVAETRILGVDHAQVGDYIGGRWRLGSAVRQGIKYHHEPQKAPMPRVVADVVATANYLAVTCGEGGGVGDASVVQPLTALLELGISSQGRKDLEGRVGEVLTRAEPLLAMAS